MSKKPEVAKSARQPWTTPELKRLGTIRDIAGPIGFGTQAGPNARS